MNQKTGFYYGWWMVIGVTLISMVTMANPFSIVLKQLMTEFSSGRGIISLIPSVATAAGALTGLFVGRLLLYHRPRVFMLCGSTICGICLLLVSVSQELWQVFTLYFINGVAGVGISALTMFTLLSKWFVKKFGTVTGITMTGGALSSIIITPIVGFLAEHYGWRTTYVFAGSMMLVVQIPIILFLLKDNPAVLNLVPDGIPAVNQTPNIATSVKSSISSPLKPLKTITISSCLKNPALWAIGFGFLLIATGDSAVTQHEVSFITDMGIAATVAATALGLTVGISAISRLSSGWLADRFSSRYVAIMFLIIEILGMIILLNAKTMSQVWIFVVTYGLATSASTTLLPLVLREIFGSENFSMLFAIVDVFFRGGFALGVPLAGFMFDATGSYTLVFTFILFFYLISVVIIYFAFGISPKPFLKK